MNDCLGNRWLSVGILHSKCLRTLPLTPGVFPWWTEVVLWLLVRRVAVKQSYLHSFDHAIQVPLVCSDCTAVVGVDRRVSQTSRATDTFPVTEFLAPVLDFQVLKCSPQAFLDVANTVKLLDMLLRILTIHLLLCQLQECPTVAAGH